MTPRLAQIRRRLSESGLDAIFISQSHNRRYLSGFTGSAGYLLISQDSSILATDFRYVEQSRSQAPQFEIMQISGDFAKWFPKMVTTLGARRIGFESEEVTFAAYQQLLQAAAKPESPPNLELVPTRGLVDAIRAVKDKDELQSIKKAAVLADAAIAHASRVLKPGTTEKELAWKLERFMREKGSEALPFEIIVASGANAALPHARPSDQEILPGAPVVIDLGARVNGYASDITRTLCLGEPSETFTRIYRIVLEAQQTALQKIRTGLTGELADALAREVIVKAGYAEKFGHGLGHGVGLDVHEWPRLGPTSADILKEGMVFTIEPGIYLAGWGGVRIEDMVVLEGSGARILTRARKLNI